MAEQTATVPTVIVTPATHDPLTLFWDGIGVDHSTGVPDAVTAGVVIAGGVKVLGFSLELSAAAGIFVGWIVYRQFRKGFVSHG